MVEDGRGPTGLVSGSRVFQLTRSNAPSGRPRALLLRNDCLFAFPEVISAIFGAFPLIWNIVESCSIECHICSQKCMLFVLSSLETEANCPFGGLQGTLTSECLRAGGWREAEI